MVLDMEQWTSFPPSAGSSRVRGSLPNQSTCVLWIWRRHLTAPPGESCGRFFGIIGMSGPLMWAVRSLYDWSQNLICITGSKSDSFPVSCELALYQASQSEGVQFGDFRIRSLLLAYHVVLLALSVHVIRSLL